MGPPGTRRRSIAGGTRETRGYGRTISHAHGADDSFGAETRAIGRMEAETFRTLHSFNMKQLPIKRDYLPLESGYGTRVHEIIVHTPHKWAGSLPRARRI